MLHSSIADGFVFAIFCLRIELAQIEENSRCVMFVLNLLGCFQFLEHQSHLQELFQWFVCCENAFQSCKLRQKNLKFSLSEEFLLDPDFPVG